MRTVLLDAARAIVPLLRDGSLRERWSEPSALSRFTVGGLTGHLVRALQTVERYLDEPEPAGTELVDAAGYYLAALGGAPAQDLDSEAHRAIRRRGEDAAAIGPAALATEHEAAIERLEARLAREPVTRAVTVANGIVTIGLDEYLRTRLAEIVIHADDLAVSIGADLPAFAPEATADVVDLLVAAAQRRHGDLALVRAMTRRERDDVDALRVL